jgi:hypothetical protein
MTATPTMPPPASHAGQLQTFIDRLSLRSGLDKRVIAAWILAEQGSFDRANLSNPLNIGPGRNYPTAAAAADATAALLKTPTYAPILRARSPLGQVLAIAQSPWDACHYRGTLSNGACAAHPVGTLLRGTFARVSSQTSTTGVPSTSGGGIGGALEGIGKKVAGDVAGAATAPARAVGGVVGAVEDVPQAITGAVDTVVGKAELGLVYVGFTVLAVVLIVLGLGKATGLLGAARTIVVRPAGSSSSAQTDEVPF